MQSNFDAFLLRLRPVLEQRQFACPDATKEMQELLGRDPVTFTNMCFDAKETPQERANVDSMISALLKNDFKGAAVLLEHSEFRPRLYKMEFVMLSVQLGAQNKLPCLRLWVDSWNLTPLQKFVIMKTYANALGMGYRRDLSEAQLAADPSFRAIMGVPHSRGVVERLALALGNLDAETRLARLPAIAPIIRRCRLQRQFTFPMNAIEATLMNLDNPFWPSETPLRYPTDYFAPDVNPLSSLAPMAPRQPKYKVVSPFDPAFPSDQF